MAQRLVRRVCPHCAEPHAPTSADLSLLGLSPESANLPAWRRGRGCSQCFQSGYLGREAIIELLNIDDTVRHLIHEGTTSQLQRQLQTGQFYSFRQAAIEKVTTGVTTIDEVRRVLPYSALGRIGREPE